MTSFTWVSLPGGNYTLAWVLYSFFAIIRALMFHSIESAIKGIKLWKLVVVVDDQDRENEWDFETAARNLTPEMINFVSKNGRSLICTALPEDWCKEPGLGLMVNNNTVLYETAFTVLVDLPGHGAAGGFSPGLVQNNTGID